MSRMLDRNKSFLQIETDRDTGKSEVEVSGTPPMLLFNLTALTSQVCDELKIPPEAYAVHLLQYIRDYKEKMLKAKIAVGINPIKREGGTP